MHLQAVSNPQPLPLWLLPLFSCAVPHEHMQDHANTAPLLPLAPACIPSCRHSSAPLDWQLKGCARRCRGVMPETLSLPNLQYFQMNKAGLRWNSSVDKPNTRGEQLPEYLAFDKCACCALAPQCVLESAGCSMVMATNGTCSASACHQEAGFAVLLPQSPGSVTGSACIPEILP